MVLEEAFNVTIYQKVSKCKETRLWDILEVILLPGFVETEISGRRYRKLFGKNKTAYRCCGLQFRDAVYLCSLGLLATQLALRE